MKNYSVKFTVNGKAGFCIMVSAPNSNMAKQVAMGEIQGQAGYAGKRIVVTSISEIR